MTESVDQMLDAFAEATAWVENAVRFVVECPTTKGEDLAPVVFLYRDGEIQLPPRLMLDEGIADEQAKERIIAWLKNLLEEEEADGYFLVNEAYAISTTDKTLYDEAVRIGVRNMPGRKEIANIIAVCRDPATRKLLVIGLSQCDIIRIDETNRITGVWESIGASDFDYRHLVTEWN